MRVQPTCVPLLEAPAPTVVEVGSRGVHAGGLRKNAAVQEKYRTIGGGSHVSTLADDAILEGSMSE